MKKSLVLVLAMALLFSCIMGSSMIASASSATDKDLGVQRASDFFNSYFTTLGAAGGGRVNVTFSVSGIMVSSVLGVSQWNVQQKISNVWTDVGAVQSGSYGTNTANHTFSRYFTGTSGNQYRVKVTFVCQNTYGTGTQIIYSSSVTA